jgi:hypothetical protein
MARQKLQQIAWLIATTVILKVTTANSETIKVDATDFMNRPEGAIAQLYRVASHPEVIVSVNKDSQFQADATVVFPPKDLVVTVRISVQSSENGVAFIPTEFALPRSDENSVVTLVATYVDAGQLDDVSAIRQLYARNPHDLGDQDLQRYFQEAASIALPRTRRTGASTAYDLLSYFVLLQSADELVTRLNFVPPPIVQKATELMQQALDDNNPAVVKAFTKPERANEAVVLGTSMTGKRFKKLWLWVVLQPPDEKKLAWFDSYLDLYQSIPTIKERGDVVRVVGIDVNEIVAARTACVAQIAKSSSGLTAAQVVGDHEARLSDLIRADRLTSNQIARAVQPAPYLRSLIGFH